jgi:acetate kinase
MKGLVGTKNFLEVLRQVQKGNKRAKLAFDIFIHRIQKYIGAYFAILGGLDVLVFTGAIGAGKPITRQRICRNLKILKGIKVLAMPTEEEWMIARQVKSLL